MALALLAFVSACGDDDDSTDADQEVTDEGAPAAGGVLGEEEPTSGEPIRIGMIADGRTPSTDNTVEFDAAEATVQFLNEHRGGFGGRPIELVTCDAQLDPALTTDCANQMVQEDVPLVYMGTHGNHEQSWQVLHEAGIPMMWGATNAPAILEDADTSYVFTNADAAIVDLPISVAEENDLDKVTVIIVNVPAALSSYDPLPEPFEDAGMDVEMIPVDIGTADMTAPLQSLAGVSDSVAHIVAFDAFCISAFNAFTALDFTGPVSGNGLCVTDATREAVPAEQLEGFSAVAGVAAGVEDETTALYRAVVEKYDPNINPDEVAGATAFTVLSGLQAVLDGTSELDPPVVTDALGSMEWMELPGAGGLHFRCNGKAIEAKPALCVRGALRTTLDAQGQSAAFEPIGDTEIED